MPLNCRTPVPLPSPVPLPVLAASDEPVPVPREGAAVRTGRGTPPPSSVSGRARVLFWSVGGLTSTGGSSLDATFCACAMAVRREQEDWWQEEAHDAAWRLWMMEDMVLTSV